MDDTVAVSREKRKVEWHHLDGVAHLSSVQYEAVGCHGVHQLVNHARSPLLLFPASLGYVGSLALPGETIMLDVDSAADIL